MEAVDSVLCRYKKSTWIFWCVMVDARSLAHYQSSAFRLSLAKPTFAQLFFHKQNSIPEYQGHNIYKDTLKSYLKTLI